MDILYTLGTGSNWDNKELLYSLRSIDRYCKNVGRVFIASVELPSFIDPATVTHVPSCDLGEIRHLNIMNKVEEAILHSDIADDFLLSSDDHFYIKPTDFDLYPYYYIEQPLKPRRQQYWQSVRDTRAFLAAHGLPTYATNPHCNTHFNRPMYIEHMDLMDEAKKLAFGGEVNHLMGNLLIASGVQPVEYRDVKIRRYSDRAELLGKIGDSHCFSISDRALECGMKEYLQELFPDKSRWEK